MAHVLNDAETLRQHRRDEAAAEYGRIIQRYDEPAPGDAARLLDLMDTLGITRQRCAVHIDGVEQCRHIRRQISKLYGEQGAVAEKIEQAKLSAANSDAAKNLAWEDKPKRDAAAIKLLDMQREHAGFNNRIAQVQGELVGKMRELHPVYTQSEIMEA